MTVHAYGACASQYKYGRRFYIRPLLRKLNGSRRQLVGRRLHAVLSVCESRWSRHWEWWKIIKCKFELSLVNDKGARETEREMEGPKVEQRRWLCWAVKINEVLIQAFSASLFTFWLLLTHTEGEIVGIQGRQYGKYLVIDFVEMQCLRVMFNVLNVCSSVIVLILFFSLWFCA